MSRVSLRMLSSLERSTNRFAWGLLIPLALIGLPFLVAPLAVPSAAQEGSEAGEEDTFFEAVDVNVVNVEVFVTDKKGNRSPA